MSSNVGMGMRPQLWCGSDRMWPGGWHPLNIVLIVAGFIIWWPVGLAVLIFTLWSGKMGCSRSGRHLPWKIERMQARLDRMRARMEGRVYGMADYDLPSTGNQAFDDYRAETLRRLEDEQRDFQGFLQRLRNAKDKAEFDQFMTELGRRPESPPSA